MSYKRILAIFLMIVLSAICYMYFLIFDEFPFVIAFGGLAFISVLIFLGDQKE